MKISAVAPVPVNEFDRVTCLSELDLDYGELKDKFKDLTKLAATIAGTHMSFVNLIDSFTQWTVSHHGLCLEQLPREESVCQYTIMNDDYFEVPDFSQDERFCDKDYVTGEPFLKYYFGVPLKTSCGFNLGALCVLDSEVRAIEPEKIELLKVIAGEIVDRLHTIRIIEDLKQKVAESRQTKIKVLHDIRGPLSGIIGLAQCIREQGDQNKLEDVLQFLAMIQKSGNSILELADEILTQEKVGQNRVNAAGSNQFNLVMLKDKLEKLYKPQALNKDVMLTVNIGSGADNEPIYKNKLLQIIGNLISNAIKFTNAGGRVIVDLELLIEGTKKTLHIIVKDNGVGMSQETVFKVLTGQESCTNGTRDEQGYGIGLVLVKHLIDSLKGTIEIFSTPGEGAIFDIRLPQN